MYTFTTQLLFTTQQPFTIPYSLQHPPFTIPYRLQHPTLFNTNTPYNTIPFTTHYPLQCPTL